MSDRCVKTTYAVAISRAHKVVAVVCASNSDVAGPGFETNCSIAYCNVEKDRIRYSESGYNYTGSLTDGVWYRIDDKNEEKMERICKHEGWYDCSDRNHQIGTYTMTWTNEPFHVQVVQTQEYKVNVMKQTDLNHHNTTIPPNYFAFSVRTAV